MKNSEDSNPVNCKRQTNYDPKNFGIINVLLIHIVRLTLRRPDIGPKHDVAPHENAEQGKVVEDPIRKHIVEVVL